MFLSMTGLIEEVADFLPRQEISWTMVIALAILFYGVISIGYFILFEYLWSGATPGKKSQEIRVIRKRWQTSYVS